MFARYLLLVVDMSHTIKTQPRRASILLFSHCELLTLERTVALLEPLRSRADLGPTSDLDITVNKPYSCPAYLG